MMNPSQIRQAYEAGELSLDQVKGLIEQLAAVDRTFPLSEGQRGLWALQRAFPERSAYNLPLAFQVDSIDPQRFREACRLLVAQHPQLGARVVEAQGEPRLQMAHPALPYIEQADLGNVDADAILEALRIRAQQPFRLEEGPLIRLHLLSVADGSTAVLLNLHHLMADGRTLAIVMQTLFDNDRALQAGEILRPIPPTPGYDAYVDAEQQLLHGDEGRRRLDYWRQQLTPPLPDFDLFTEKPRSDPRVRLQGETLSTTLETGVSERIKRFVRERHLYPTALFLGLWKVLLQRYSGQSDLIVGMPVNERTDSRFDELVGFFVNMVPIRSQCEEATPFNQFLDGLQRRMLDARSNSYPFPALVRALQIPAGESGSPLFDVAFSYQDFHQGIDSESLPIRPIHGVQQQGEYELVLEVVERAEVFDLHWKYNPALYSDATIQRMSAGITTLIEAVMGQPERPLGALQAILEAEEQPLIATWNSTLVEYPGHRCVHELFLEQAQQTPQRVALRFGDDSLTYQELAERSAALARTLQTAGVSAGNRMALCVERSLDMVVGLLGILRAGAAYLPLDPGFPHSRLTQIVEHSEVDGVLTQQQLRPKVNQLLADAGRSEATLLVIDELDLGQACDADSSVLADEAAGPDDLAYLIYTSGSTGTPKGVMIAHRALTNFLCAMAERPGLTAEDRLLAVTTLSFDIAGLELFLPLIVGAECDICDTATARDAERLKGRLAQRPPTVMQATPSTWSLLFRVGWRNEQGLRVWCGGEALPQELRQRFAETGSELWNLFGPTETTIWSTLERLDGPGQVTIGRPINNTEIHILDRRGRRAPIGMPGELCVAGDGLAEGYFKAPELTSERFIDDPSQPGRRLYRTGDLARWLPDGRIEMQGRMDWQVKLNGHRIEPEEIEFQLDRQPEIEQSVVVVQQEEEFGRLVAFYQPSPGTPPDAPALEESLRARLKQQLPHYMVPALFVALDAFPLTPNGKTDRVALRRYRPGRETTAGDQSVTTELEQELLGIWRETLHRESIAPTDRFFDVGGDSVSAVVLADRIADRLQLPFTVTDLFSHYSIRGIAEHLQGVLPARSSTETPDPAAVPTAAAEYPGDEASTFPDYYRESFAIVGISCRLPDADHHWAFWENLVAGRDSAQFFSEEELRQAGVAESLLRNPDYVPMQLSISDKDRFDPEFFSLSRRSAAYMDPQFRLLLMHAWEAVEDAGYACEAIPDTSVFMSVSNSYYQTLLRNLGAIDRSDEYVAWLLSQGGTIPTMISYELGLRGPSLFVHSNCSSGLSALASACHSLGAGEARCALVGAAKLAPSSAPGYLYEQGLNFSSDGRCRAFDAAADGMTNGEGVAVIVVKRALDAIADGDHIYALLRGIGLNNDGAQKAGFYAPSVAGQSEIIERVLSASGVDPQSIGYVEAHGTGTALGDPVEVRALSEVYRRYTDRKQFCGLGSVKTNIGHLDTAAGLAGCLKVALSLSEGAIPPSLHYRQPNPQIAFADSPFYVVDRLTEWPEATTPRRAAVSSFGIGGTNAHAVLEAFEATSTDAVAPTGATSACPCLIPLSAKSEERLIAYVEKLLDFLNGQPTRVPPLRELAYTYQVGRSPMPCRVAFLVQSVEELVEALSAYLQGESDGERRFQGGRSADGGAQLLGDDEDSRALIVKWLNKGRLDRLAAYWVQGGFVDWSLLYPESRPRRASLPTYPFSREPCGPEGAAAVPAAASSTRAWLHPLVQENTSDLSGASFRTEFNGGEFFFRDHRIQGVAVLPAVAYMEMAQAAIRLALTPQQRESAQIQLQNLLWLRPVTLDTETQQLRITLFPEESGEIVFEVTTASVDAEGEALLHCQGSALIHNASEPIRLPLEQLRASITEQRVDGTRCFALCRAGGYEHGPALRGIREVAVGAQESLAELYLPESVSAEAGAFRLHPSLLESALIAALPLKLGASIAQLESDVAAAAGPVTLPFALDRLDIYGPTEPTQWAWIRWSGDSSARVPKLDIDLCRADGEVCVRLQGLSYRLLDGEPGEAESQPVGALLCRPHWQELMLQPNDPPAEAVPERPHLVFSCAIPDRQIPTPVPGVWSLVRLESEQPTLAARFEACTQQLLSALQERLEMPPKSGALIQLLVPETGPDRVYSALGALLRSAHLEHPWLSVQTLSVAEEDSAETLDARIRHCSQLPLADASIRWQSGGPQLLGLQALPEYEGSPDSPWRQRGSYLITGGAGGLGLHFAQEIVEQVGAVQLFLIGRSPLDVSAEAVIETLRERGARIEYRMLDVSDLAALRSLVEEIRRDCGGLQGILHAAGKLNDERILNKSVEAFGQVLAPKVEGLMNLDQVSQQAPELELFLLFSSVSGHFGNPGQADYATANAFLDAYADHRNALVAAGERSGRTLAIAWPLWCDGGMSVDSATEQLLQQNFGLTPMPTATGFATLYRGLQQEGPRVLVAHGMVEQIRHQLLSRGASERPSAGTTGDSGDADPQLLEQITRALMQQMGRLVDVTPEQLDPKAELSRYGFDSISFTKLANALNKAFTLGLTPTLFFEYPTLEQLAAHLAAAYAGHFRQAFSGSAAKPHVAGPAQSKPRPAASVVRTQRRPVRSEVASEQSQDGAIAIIGMSGRFPMAPDLDSYWENLRQGRDCIEEIPPERWDWRAFYGDPMTEPNKTRVKWGGFIDGIGEFDPLFFGVSPREAELMDPQQRLLMTYIWMAIEDAGYAPASLSGSNTAIFVGTSNSTYGTLVAKANVAIDGAMTSTGAPSMGPNRMSYMLDLHGPSEPIETACSSSLVAIHRAVTLIERGECDQAIVGGVHTIVTADAHIAFDKAFALAADGRCKPFSDQADGFALGEGVGMLFLKRRDAAERDGDHIYGLIRGSSENHGGKASSPNAPNPKAQADLLMQAYRKAGIDPATVGYIEAHGTGTKLGDPTEINGLKRAFRELAADSGTPLDQPRSCGLGSVKSNIGHAVFAAGVAGVIKVLLQMRHRQLVKTLHCQQTNPYLELDDSPFYIVDQQREWPRMRDADGVELPLRAGVSSFGLGGVNAHIVLEEYQAPERDVEQAASQGPVMIVLSARDADRLQQSVKNLQQFLQAAAPEAVPDLRDLGYTLQLGREAMDERLGLVVESIDELIERLESFLEHPQQNHNLFRGQVQRNREAVALFAADEDLREITGKWIERRRYARILEWWVKGLAFDWNRLYRNQRPRRLALPTYPFVRDHYWVPLGETAQQVVGAVSRLHPLVHRNSSTFAEQRFSSTFNGEEFFLRDHRIHGTPVLPGVALLEMVQAAVQQSMGADGLGGLRLELVNFVWLRPIRVGETVEEIHIRLVSAENGEIHYTVFSSAQEGEGDSERVHGQGVARLHANVGDAPALDIPALRERITTETIAAERCYALCQASGLVHGPGMCGIEQLYAAPGEVLSRLRLPDDGVDGCAEFGLHPALLDASLVSALPLSFDFSHWEETIDRVRAGASRSAVPFALERLQIYRACPREMWAWIRPAEGSTERVPRLDLDLCDDAGHLCVQMRGYSARVLDGASPTSRVVSPGTLLLTPVWRDRPARPVGDGGGFAEHRLYCCGLAPEREALKRLIPELSLIQLEANERGVEEQFAQHALTLLADIRELSGREPRVPTLLQLLVPIAGESGLQRALFALLRSACLEHSNLSCQLLQAEGGIPAAGLLDIIEQGRHFPDDLVLGYDRVGAESGSGLRHRVRSLEPIPAMPDSDDIPWKQGGVYLVTGGAGRLGQLFARELLQQVADATLILVGRSDVHSSRLDDLTGNGGKVVYRRVDIRDLAAVHRLVAEIERDYGALNGVIHAAGMNRDNLIRAKSDAEFIEVLDPKVRGVVNLDRATRQCPLDLFVLFSSLSGVLGNAGQSDYATANAFLDAFAEYRHALCKRGERSGQTLSIDWPFWRDGGMPIDEATQTLMRERVGLVAMETESGLQAFYRAVASGLPQVVVLSGDLPRLQQGLLAVMPPAVPENQPAAPQETTTVEPERLKRRVREALIQVICRVQKMDPSMLEDTSEFSHYGFESIAFTNFANQLNQQYGLDITPTIFFEYPTLGRLVSYLLETHSAVLSRALLPDHDVAAESPVDADSVPAAASRLRPQTRSATLPTALPKQPAENNAEPIAIIGISGKFPMAEDLQAFWDNLDSGRDCISEIPEDRWDWRAIFGDPQQEGDKTNIRWGGFIDGVGEFDPAFFGISPHEAALMDPQQRLLMSYVWLAIEDAGYAASSLAGSDTGLFIGTSAGGYGTLIANAKIAIDGVMTTTGAPSMGPNRMSYLLDLRGPSEPIETACSSSLVALHRAVVFIRQGECEQAIVGGVQTVVTPAGHIAFGKASALAQDGRCKPFSDRADGFAIGEGVGMLFLKRLSAAERDGDHIYGVIRGSAENHDGRANSPTTPNPNAQADLLVRAYRNAGIDPTTVSYIETHGTGTRLGDPTEIQGLKKAFSELYRAFGHEGVRDAHCGLGSVKSNIGHTVFTAGVAGVIKVLLQLRHQRLVKSLHAENLNPYIDLQGSPFYVLQEARDWTPINGPDGRPLPRRAGISSFGLGGVNAHVIIEEYRPQVPDKELSSTSLPPLFVFSARNNERLKELVGRWLTFIDGYDAESAQRDLLPMAYTLQVGREAMEERLAVSAESLGQLQQRLRSYLADEPLAEGMYRGNIRQSREALAIFNEDGDAASVVSAWVEKRKYNKLLELWTKGLHFDWASLYAGQRPRRLPLPTYPLKRKRYWFDTLVGGGAPAAAPSTTTKLPVSQAAGDGETNTRAAPITLADPASLVSATGQQQENGQGQRASCVLKSVDVLDDLKSAMPATERGMVPTLNRTGVMTEILNPCSTAFAEFAGRCGGEVLDIGCAYGVATVAALEQGARVLAVDMERKHLDILTDRLREEALDRVSTQQGILPEVDFESGRFAAVHASRVIHFLKPEEVQLALRKMFDWLQPGGKLFLVSDSPYVGYWAPKASDYEARKRAGDPWPGYIEDVRQMFDDSLVTGGPTLINPLDPEILRRECEAAGFTVERVGFEGIGRDLKIVVATEGRDHASVIAVKPGVVKIDLDASVNRPLPECSAVDALSVPIAVNIESVRERVRAMLAAELDMEPDEIDDEMSFIDMGLDSITSVTWFKKMNTHFALSLPATKVYDYPNVVQFSEFLVKQLQANSGMSHDRPSEQQPPQDLKSLLRQVQQSQLDTAEASRLFEQLQQGNPPGGES